MDKTKHIFSSFYIKIIFIFNVLIFLCFNANSQTYTKTYVYLVNSYIDLVNKCSWGISQNYFIISDSYYWQRTDSNNISQTFQRHSFIGELESKYDFDDEYVTVSIMSKNLNEKHKKLMEITDSIYITYKNIIDYSFEIKSHILGRLYMNDNFKHFFDIIDNCVILYSRYNSFLTDFRIEIHKISMDILKNNPENENMIAEMRMRNALDYQLPLLYKWSLYMNEAEFPFELMKENFEHTENVFLNYEKTPDIDPNTRFNYKRFYSYLDYENQRFKREYLKNYDPETKDSKADFVIWNLISAYDVRCVREHDLFIDEANKIGSYMLKYPMQPYLFIRENDPEEVKKEEILINEKIYKNEEEILYETMEGFPANNLVLLLDVSASMNTNDKIGLLKKSFIRLLKILREEDYVSIIIYSGDAQIILPPTSCTEKVKITEILNNLKTGGNTNIGEGLDLALKTASKNFIAGGNNRIILATDGEFSLDEKYFKKIEKLASKEIYFSVFQFKKEKYIDILSKMAQSGKGNYEILNTNNIALKLIKEAKAIQQIKK